ncbi:hypothetical protein SDC9_210600 [bioreactor metagenome]|uniref:Uncharacterized protein n=1 Tax=bioreactor metagenome TaxID=1076179 RepID=A0A645JHM7_9ZZZZ
MFQSAGEIALQIKHFALAPIILSSVAACCSESGELQIDIHIITFALLLGHATEPVVVLPQHVTLAGKELSHTLCLLHPPKAHHVQGLTNHLSGSVTGRLPISVQSGLARPEQLGTSLIRIDQGIAGIGALILG